MKKVRNYKQLLYPLALIPLMLGVNTYCSWDQSRYFETAFLRQHTLVQKALVSDGFKQGFFPTDDGYSLSYLWLTRPQAIHTIIFCAGFWPGAKEGLASFYALMPENCNILFFDARGHGSSSGSFARSIWTYGSTEYRDIISAIKFAHGQSDLPIIVHGICSGAFHAAHAILDLQNKGLIETYHVRGLVFDSGWNDIWIVAKSALRSELSTRIKAFLAPTGSSIASVGSRIADIGTILTHFILTPLYRITPHRNPLNKIIKQFVLPVFYIHMEGDVYSSCWEVQKLAALTPNATCWWITEPSKHACHHLKFKHAYRERLNTFIHEVV